MKRALPSGLRLAGPAVLDRQEKQVQVTPWTVVPEEYADFLIAIYEDWVRHDVGRVFVMNFEWALNAWIGNPSPVCIHAQQCGRAVVIEHNGDVYACDHFVYQPYRLGNIAEDTLAHMVEKSLNTGFGRHEGDRSAWVVQGLPGTEGLPGRVPEAPLPEEPPWRAGAPLPLRRVQEVLPPHPQVSESHGHVAGKRPPGLTRDGRHRCTAADTDGR